MFFLSQPVFGWPGLKVSLDRQEKMGFGQVLSQVTRKPCMTLPPGGTKGTGQGRTGRLSWLSLKMRLGNWETED